jgi:hypothetical protein
LVLIALTPDHFHSMIPSGGASGAISGCMGMYLLVCGDVEVQFKYFFWLYVYVRAGEFELPAWVPICFWFGRDLLFGVLGFLLGTNIGGVGYGAHVGGLLGGLSLAAAYRWLGRPREEESAESELIIDPREAFAATRHRVMPAAVATSETPTIYLHDGHQQTGPFTLTAVQEMLQHGQISRDACYWSEGMADWQGVEDLAGQPLG